MELLAELFVGLEGLQLVLPSKATLSPGWELRLNPHHEAIYEDLTSWVRSSYSDIKPRKIIAYLDAPLFVAGGFPSTGRQELLTLAKFFAWYFPWDDAIDENEVENLEDIARYHHDTVAVMQSSLDAKIGSVPINSDARIESFRSIGQEIRRGGTAEATQLFSDTLCDYVDSTIESHFQREGETVVTVEDYLRRREENIGLYPLLALISYATKIQLSPQYFPENNVDMYTIWAECARIVITTNDLVSLPKELKQGQFESLVPLLMYHHELKPQEAIDHVLQIRYQSYARLEEAEKRLYAEAALVDLHSLKEFVTGCKNTVVAELNWTYSVKRYKDSVRMQEDGTILFEISLPAVQSG